MAKKRKNIDLECLSTTDPKVKEMLKLGVPPGMYHTSMDEDMPVFERSASEVVLNGNHNSAIVLGRDRNASLASGYGGRGGTGCGSIDMVVGRLGCLSKADGGFGPFRRKRQCADGSILTGPNFAADSGRIWLSQRGDVDKYFALVKGRSFVSSTSNASAVAMKADHCRVIGRESVRIYAGKGNFEGLGFSGELNSKGGEIGTRGVIELCASHHADDLQPVALGTSTATAIKKLHAHVRQCYGAIHAIHILQAKIFSYLGAHFHTGGGVGVIVTGPDPTLLGLSYEKFAKDLVGNFDQIMSQINSYVDEMAASGVGKESAFIPGWEDIRSQSVFTT